MSRAKVRRAKARVERVVAAYVGEAHRGLHWRKTACLCSCHVTVGARCDDPKHCG